MKKRFLSAILCLCMVLALIPTVAFAAEVKTPVSNEVEQSAQVNAGNSIDTAASISFGNRYNGTISENDKQDFYKLTLPTSGTLKLTLTSYVDQETVYYLFDEDRKTLKNQWGYQNSTTGITILEFEYCLTSGTYYFEVASDYKHKGDYTFTFDFTSAEESFRETNGGINNSIRNPSNISLNTMYRGQIAENDDRDFYKFTLSTSDNVTLFSTSYIKNTTEYYLLDENGKTVENWYGYQNSSTGMSTLDEEMSLAAGTYYFEVSSAYYCGNYFFKISTSSGSTPSIPDTPSGTFNDVPSNAYYAEAVAWAVDKGITNGTSSTAFSPNATCTRAQVIQMLWAAMGKTSVSNSISFWDVSSRDYYYNAVRWAVRNGVTSGTSPNTFSPNQSCTRAQVITFLWNALEQPYASGSISFRDVSSSAYYYNAVKWAVGKGVTSGTTDTTFSPNAGCTRAQVVTFIYKAMN